MSWADNRSHRQFYIVEIVYDFFNDASSARIKIACDSRKQKSYHVNRPLAVKIGKKQREMTKIKFYQESHDGEILIFCLSMNVIPTKMFQDSSHTFYEFNECE